MIDKKSGAKRDCILLIILDVMQLSNILSLQSLAL